MSLMMHMLMLVGFVLVLQVFSKLSLATATTNDNAPNILDCPAQIDIIAKDITAGDIFLGQTLLCQPSVDDPSATYIWTLKETGALSAGQEVRVTRAGVNTFTCTMTISTCIMSASRTVLVSAKSCLQILQFDSKAATKQYTLATATGKRFNVYCEMGLNGGGYTFLSPDSLLDLTNDDIQSIYTDKASWLLRFKQCDNTQPYTVLRQLAQYSAVPLYVGLNTNTGYALYPYNSPTAYLGSPYLVFGFLPVDYYTTVTTAGLLSNNIAVTYTKAMADYQPNHMALLPGFQSTTPYIMQGNQNLCAKFFATTLPNPTGRAMPDEFFMFYELWLDWFCQATTNGNGMNEARLTTAAIGFR